MPVDEECLVCEQPGHGTHFGAFTCRACAAFFRRTSLLNSNYVCRLGKENCPIAKNERYLCRLCRFNKCKRMGMSKENIQMNRDRSTSRITKTPKVSFSTPKSSPEETDDGSEPSTSTSSQQRKVDIYKRPQKCVVDSEKNHIDSDGKEKAKFILDLSPLTKNIRTILDTFIPDIDAPVPLTAMQRMLFGLIFVRRNQSKDPERYEFREELDEFEDEWIDYYESIAKFMKHSEQFAALELEDKITIFRSTWSTVQHVETISRSIDLFGTDVTSEYKFACFDNVYINESIKWRDPEVSDDDGAQFKEMITPSVRRLLDVVAKTILEMKLTEYELVFILIQLIWHVEGRGVSPATERIADAYRERISDELHDYYIHEQKMPRYADRLMKLMELIQKIEEHEYERSRLIEMMSVLDICRIDVADAEVIGTNQF